MKESRFVVQGIAPVHDPHVISGPSGSNKTGLLLQIAHDWSQGKDIFGYKSFPTDYCIVACDRSNASLEDHMQALGMNPRAMPHFSLIGRTETEGRNDHNFESLLRIARQPSCSPQVKTIFADGLASLCSGKLNDAKEVTSFLRYLTRELHSQGLSLLGTLCSAKAREGNGYPSPRDRIAGSASWSSNTSLKILIEPAHPENVEDPHRIVYLLPQLLPAQRLHYVLENSLLVPCEVPLLLSPMDQWLAQQKGGMRFTTAITNEVGETFGYKDRYVSAWLREQCELGLLIKLAHGRYEVPAPL